MPGYGASKATHRLFVTDYNGSDDWVDIKEARTSAATLRYRSAGMNIQGADVDGRPIVSAELNQAAMRNVLFQSSIVTWTLKADDADSAPMPLSPTTFDNLDADFADWLDRRITAYYATRRLTEDALGELNAPSTAP